LEFNTLGAWRIEAIGSGATPPKSQPTQMEEPVGDSDKLPF
jgi:hypothetical protein